MSTRAIRMSDVVKRDWPDFVIQYELIEPDYLRHFPGSILNFSYTEFPDYNDIHCDIFPEFKKPGETSKLIAPCKPIPRKGTADMWIVSDKSRENHFNKLMEGGECYLFNGNKLVAKCSITTVYQEYKMAQ